MKVKRMTPMTPLELIACMWISTCIVILVGAYLTCERPSEPKRTNPPRMSSHDEKWLEEITTDL
jgi:hypothetical protein